MNVSFIHKDDDYFGTKELITPIANLVIKHEKFVFLTCTVIKQCDTYNEHIVKDVAEILKRGCYLFRNEPDALLEYQTLSSLIENFYLTILDDEFERNICAYNEDHYYKCGLRFKDGRLGRYRGLLLEEIVTSVIRDRFDNYQFETGCLIKINSDPVIFRYGPGNSRRKQTIDVAGWINDLIYGEFYECKVSPQKFTDENYQYLMTLDDALKRSGSTRHIIGFVSADMRVNLEIQKKDLESNNGCQCNFLLIGRDDIYNLLNCKIPDIV